MSRIEEKRIRELKMGNWREMEGEGVLGAGKEERGEERSLSVKLSPERRKGQDERGHPFM